MAQQPYSGVSDQGKASKHRFADAEALFKEKRWRGAMYVGGYAVECVLKAKLMRMFRCVDMRELEDELKRRKILRADATIYTHHLVLLLKLTQSINRMRQNGPVWQQFNVVNRWIPAWRYSSDLAKRDDAEDFLAAVKTVIQWIEHST